MPSDPELPRGAARAVGGIFRSAREMQRLSQHQVAALTDAMPWRISRTAIGDIERGRSLPGIEALVSLAGCCGSIRRQGGGSRE
jgi:transcriptional regulator with XRE-family HTH domain